MSLFRDAMRPEPIASDEAVRRYLAALRPTVDPDPLFRRRLRGLVVNQFVAAREGLAVARAPRTRSNAMGRLGRACLYASVALAASVGSVMAASQAAIPGDPLYSVKVHIEELRVQALPAEYRDELAAHVLSERVSELARLEEAGKWELAAEMAQPIGDAYAALEATGADPSTADGALGEQLDTLSALIARLPERAQAAVAQAAEHAPAFGGTNNGGTTDGGVDAGGGNGNGGTNNGGVNAGGNGNGGTNHGGTNHGGTNHGGTNHGGTNHGGTNHGGGNNGGGKDEPEAPDGQDAGEKAHGPSLPKVTDDLGATPKPSPGTRGHSSNAP
jgi:hypothetical protein